MYNYFIEKYISSLEKKDIYDFAYNNGVSLNSNEIDILFYYIKKDYHTIIYGNPDNIFNDLRNKLEDNTYNKMLELYYFYKEKYGNYL